jgi:hypothetical protein
VGIEIVGKGRHKLVEVGHCMDGILMTAASAIVKRDRGSIDIE